MVSMRRTAVLLLVFAVLFIGCEKESVEEVSLQEDNVLSTPPPAKNELRIAISAIISPKKTFIYYKEMLDYISKRTGMPVKLVQRDTYEEVNELIRDNKIQAAFVCSGAYVNGHRDFGMEILAAPKAYGEPYYYSYLIVPADSEAKKFEDLKGKEYAFTDPMSNSGKLVPTYMLAKMGETPGTFFSKYIFTYSHDKSIEAVAEGLVDGASVDSLIWDYINTVTPKFTSKTKIIKKSPPYGIPPVVVPKGLDPQLKKKLKEIFLNMHIDKESKPMLKKLNIDSFIEIEDSAYDSIREMAKWVGKQSESEE